MGKGEGRGVDRGRKGRGCMRNEVGEGCMGKRREMHVRYGKLCMADKRMC